MKITGKKTWSVLDIVGLTFLTMFVTGFAMRYFRGKRLPKTEGVIDTSTTEENTDVDPSNGLTRNFYMKRG